MKNKTCPFQDWVLTQGDVLAQNEHDETDPRTRPDWLRMSKQDRRPSASSCKYPNRTGDDCPLAFAGKRDRL